MNWKLECCVAGYKPKDRCWISSCKGLFRTRKEARQEIKNAQVRGTICQYRIVKVK
jgi:hypothetical protein